MAESAAGVSGQLAAVSMVTVPGEGETVHEAKPAIKANLATMGDVEPGTVEIRISGVGAVPVKYDPATKLAEAVLLQPLKDRQVTVLLSAQVRGRKVETRWNFVCDAAPNVSAPVHGTAVPVNGTSAPVNGTVVPAKGGASGGAPARAGAGPGAGAAVPPAPGGASVSGGVPVSGAGSSPARAAQLGAETPAAPQKPATPSTMPTPATSAVEPVAAPPAVSGGVAK